MVPGFKPSTLRLYNKNSISSANYHGGIAGILRVSEATPREFISGLETRSTFPNSLSNSVKGVGARRRRGDADERKERGKEDWWRGAGTSPL